MADTKVYTIKTTDGTTILTIQPGTLDGPTGAIQHTDLSLHGSGFPGWGEAVNENFLRLIENFACEQRAENLPNTVNELGEDFGINYPIIGQLWFNKTNQYIYLYTTTGWKRLLDIRDSFQEDVVTNGTTLGTGAAVLKEVANGVMQFRGITGEGSIQVRETADSVVISSTGLAGAENIAGTGATLGSVTDSRLFLKRLKAGTGIGLVETATDITINNTGAGTGVPEITYIPVTMTGYTFSAVNSVPRLITSVSTLSGTSETSANASKEITVYVNKDELQNVITVPATAEYAVILSRLNVNAAGNNKIHNYTRTNSSQTYIHQQMIDPSAPEWEGEDTSILIVPFDTPTKSFQMKVTSARNSVTTSSDEVREHVNLVGFMMKETLNIPVYNPSNSAYVKIVGDTMTGFLTLNADPTANLHAATKQYVDSQSVGRNMIINGDFVHWQRGERLNFFKTVTNNEWITDTTGNRPITRWKNNHSWDGIGSSIVGNDYVDEASLNSSNLISSVGFTPILQANPDGSGGYEGLTSYTADRWNYNHYDQGGNGGIVVRRTTDTTAPFEGINAMEVVVTASQPVTGASAWSVVSQRIEGYNTSRLRWGLSGANAATLSFWVRSTVAGLYSICIRNQYHQIPANQQRSYIVDYTINAVNTWEKKTITIPGCTTGSWLKDQRIGVEILWLLAAGGGLRTTTTNQWITSGPIASNASTNFTTVNGASWQLAQVQFEMGSRATNFEHLPTALTKQMCEYYYQVGTFIESAQPSNPALNDSHTNEFQIKFGTTMREVPTVYPLFFSAGCTGISPIYTSGNNCNNKTINIGPVPGGPYAAWITKDKFTVEYAVFVSYGDVVLEGTWFADAELY